MNLKKYQLLLLALLVLSSCGQEKKQVSKNSITQKTETMFAPIEGKVKIMNLDPGHFHASLVQKTMYDGMDPVVHVFAPDGPEVVSYLSRIKDYNARAENPTSWEEKVYTGDDFLEKMLAEKPGNVMVVSGNNAKKTEHILKSVQAGIHVLADKPMVITPEKFPMLEKAFEEARENGVLLYDIMTERYEINTMLQKELSQIPEVFGKLQTGSPDKPAITKESVHHFSKYVSGKPLVRPPWFFDVKQQGEGIVDVTTHLVDLIQWEAFPEIVLTKEDVEIISGKRWTTDLTPEMFKKVTELDSYPEYLVKDTDGDLLKVYSNGEIIYKLKGIHAKASVIWNYQAPEGTGDTHYSIMHGTKCNLEIKQGEEEGYKPLLYIEHTGSGDPVPFESNLNKVIDQNLVVKYPGIQLKKLEERRWLLEIPDSYKVGHEAHFGQVTEKFLEYLGSGELPEWEIPNMIVKYYTTTEGMKKAME
ncbi:MAG: Gfo/Idh/MocA family oxidoreductase [Bacteroidales bacterium]|nr:Gfo/Idh/MocA family oxidoreductase [Bacteroidales bacterium]